MTVYSFDHDSANSKYDVVFHFIYHDFPFLHQHDYWEFPVVLSGSVQHIINKKSVLLQQNTACLIRPSDCHKLVHSTTDLSLLNILIRDSYMRKVCGYYSEDTYEKLLSSSEIQLDLTKEHSSQLFSDSFQLLKNESSDKEYNLLSSIIIFSILEQVVRLHIQADSKDETVRPKWLSNLQELTMKFENRAWSIKDMVRESGYCHSHFCREFIKYMGCTPIKHLTKIKMLHACNYLSFSDKSIYDISQDLGYSTPSHFNEMFHSVYHMSPSQYRKQNRQK